MGCNEEIWAGKRGQGSGDVGRSMAIAVTDDWKEYMLLLWMVIDVIRIPECQVAPVTLRFEHITGKTGIRINQQRSYDGICFILTLNYIPISLKQLRLLLRLQ